MLYYILLNESHFKVPWWWMMAYQQSYVDTDVREVFKTHTVEQTQIIHKKINYEIERKREELRMLVG